jgi:hypothetical protein
MKEIPFIAGPDFRVLAGKSSTGPETTHKMEASRTNSLAAGCVRHTRTAHFPAAAMMFVLLLFHFS